MKARKLNSGSWQVQVLDYIDENGKRHVRSFTSKSKTQAEYEAAKFKAERTEGGRDGSVADMVERVLRQKAPSFSPSTLRGYTKILKNQIRPAPFGRVRISSLSTDKIQAWIAWMLAKDLSPKSIKNAYGMFNACYQFYGGEKIFRVKLPQAQAKRKHVPSIADVKMVMEHFKDDPDMTAAVRLGAVAGLRRGEVCALTSKDVDRKRKMITINKAMTETPSGEWIVKVPKTYASIRSVPVPDFVLEALPKNGKVVNIAPAQVTNRFNRAVKKLPVEPFSFHDLRHFCASMMHNKGASDITIQSSVGWSSAIIMKDTYWGDVQEEKARQLSKYNSFVEKTFRLES